MRCRCVAGARCWIAADVVSCSWVTAAVWNKVKSDSTSALVDTAVTATSLSVSDGACDKFDNDINNYYNQN